ncbi:MAG TPA: hypothetical protein VIG33_15390 [Pseudobdellovibrionaceae bacterium]|jgi:hypothetical protein
MKFIFCLFTFILFLSEFDSAFATESEYIEIHEAFYPRIELTLAGGLALQTGYLTTKASLGTYIFGVNFVMPGGLMSFDWQGFHADHDTGEFPLNNNKSVTVSTFSFIPHVRVFNHEAWNAYVGLGFTQVSLYQTSPEYMVDYGSFVFSGLLRYELNNKWSVLYKTQWYNVNKTENDQKTSFEVWNHAIGAGYSFF